MDLIFAQYYNIGPFKNKLVNLNFKKGKFVIKAPIGKGKSFLFFDSPFFALYGSKQRNILNRKSQNGFVKLIFEVNEQFYLIERQIKATRSGGESVQSRLFVINSGLDVFLQKYGNKILDFQTLNSFEVKKLKYDFLNLEEIKFKSSSELQKTLNQLLPPKEVFLSTHFLMQDSDNIFEMTPSERINVFKNIFGLLGIDEAKDIISDERKEVITKLKMLSSDEVWKNKFEELKSKLNLLWSNLANFVEEDLTMDLLAPGITKPRQIDFSKYFKIIDERKKIYQSFLTQKNTLNQQLKEIEGKIMDYNLKISNLEKTIKQLENKIKDFDENKLNLLREEKKRLLAEQKSIIDQYFQSIDLNSININGFEKDIDFIYQFVNETIQQGLTLKKELENIDLKIENLKQTFNQLNEKLLDLEIKPGTLAFERFNKEKQILKQKVLSDITKIELLIKNLKKEKEKILKDLDRFSKEYSQIEDILKQQLTFKCELINDNCPFLRKIKGKEIKHFEEKLISIDKEIKNLNEKIKEIDKEIEEYNKNLTELKDKLTKIEKGENQFFEDFFADLEKERKNILNQIKELRLEENIKKLNLSKQNINKQIEEKRDLLKKLNYSLLKKVYEKYKNLELKLKNIDEQIINFESKEKLVKEKKDQILKFKTEIQNYKEFILSLINQKEQIKKQIVEIDEKLKEQNIDYYLNLEEKLKEFEKYYIQWQKLYEDYKEAQLEVEKLKEKQKILTDLYNIFSKELMIIVLDDFLPKLFEVINNNLLKVVDFQLGYELKKTKSDKLELEIYVKDDKGERPIKSLSGGQKTVLRLAWILSVAVLAKVKFLFLDETINNLDIDSIGRVADMLKEFVDYNDIKFYVVTHSKQIQDMNIWDEVITID